MRRGLIQDSPAPAYGLPSLAWQSAEFPRMPVIRHDPRNRLGEPRLRLFRHR